VQLILVLNNNDLEALRLGHRLYVGDLDAGLALAVTPGNINLTDITAIERGGTVLVEVDGIEGDGND